MAAWVVMAAMVPGRVAAATRMKRGGCRAAVILIAFAGIGSGGCSPAGLVIGAGATAGVAAAQERPIDEAVSDTAIKLQLNGRFLNEDLEREIRRTSRTSKDLTVALLDLDNYSAFNETYGNLKGDDVLADIGHIIQASIRKGIDIAYRYGGDEFMLILPETDLEQAAQTLDRILEKLEWRIEEKLTFSVGLALLGDCNEASDLVVGAREAMHQARDSGGDTVVKLVCKASEDKWLDGTRRI